MNFSVRRMDIVSPLVTKALSYWKVIAAVVVVGIVAFFAYRKFWNSSAQGFTTMGAECDPQIENSCGKGAICQSDDSGVKGVCFPLPEEEAAEAKEEVVQIASAGEAEQTAEEEESSS